MSTEFVIGQKAAVYSSHFGGANVTPVTVERDTKLYWVVTGGRKFRKTDGMEPGDRDAWHTPAKLLQVDDPLVVQAAKEQRIANKYTEFIRAVDAVRGDKQNIERIDALEQALKEYKAVLEA